MTGLSHRLVAVCFCSGEKAVHRRYFHRLTVPVPSGFRCAESNASRRQKTGIQDLSPLFYKIFHGDDEGEDTSSLVPSSRSDLTTVADGDETLARTVANSQSHSISSEWQDSFTRNGLADFVPPFCDTSRLNCLALAEFGDGAFLTRSSTQLARKSSVDKATRHVESQSLAQTKKIDHPTVRKLNGSQSLFSYDIIFDDRGLMIELLTSVSQRVKADLGGPGSMMKIGNQSKGLATNKNSCTSIRNVIQCQLVISRALKEYGIYVVMTRSALSPSTKTQLLTIGQVMGLQWEFDLDCCTEQGQFVSVARRIATKPLPGSSHRPLPENGSIPTLPN